MAIVEFETKDHVAIMTWNNGENRHNPDFLKSFFECMDAIENDTECTALVVRSSDPKIWSNGLDLDWLMQNMGEPPVTKKFFYTLNDFFKRILMSPLVTIACINGHAFANGAICSCAFDYRFMRTDRGFFCFPEVDLGIPFLPGMHALLRKAIPVPAFHDLSLSGRRITAQQCVDAGIMEGAYHLDELFDKVMEFAGTMNKRRVVIQAIKETMYGHIIKIIDEDDPPVIESGRLQV